MQPHQHFKLKQQRLHRQGKVLLQSFALSHNVASETESDIVRMLPKRKTKTLPTPVLVPPGQLSLKPDLWDCAALLVDKPQTWTSFDVCGKLKGVLRVKKVSIASRSI